VKAHKHPDYQASYDAVAEEYVRRIAGELEHKPLDRKLLDRFAASRHGAGPDLRSRKSSSGNRIPTSSIKAGVRALMLGLFTPPM
jgi:hypothetical protein